MGENVFSKAIYSVGTLVILFNNFAFGVPASHDDDVRLVILSQSGKIHTIDVVAHRLSKGIVGQVAMFAHHLSRHCHDAIQRRKTIGPDVLGKGQLNVE